MAGREELAALLFEMQRARGPIDKARAAARAWRTLRELSPTERRMIAREIGSSGADELLESLGGGGRGFSPAAVLDALTRVGNDDRTSLDEIVADLRDPERRTEAVVDMLDAAADVAIGQAEPEKEDPTDPEPETVLPPVPVVEEEPTSNSDPEDAAAASVGTEEADAGWEVGTAQPPDPLPPPPAAPQPLPPAPRAPSAWDELLRRPPEVPGPVGESTVEWSKPADVATSGVGERPVSVLRRLRRIRDQRAEFASAPVSRLRSALDTFPEPWARRRALCFLLAEGIPADIGDALDLVADLERPTDRRWCLGALAERGDLIGEDLDRALDLLASSSARRRLARRAALDTHRS